MLKTINTNSSNFEEIAKTILLQSILCVKDDEYDICEIEFYYRGKEHDDTYTHGMPDQKTKGKFYFHKYKTGTYKSGTYKGCDITLAPDKKTYFGALIRSICDRKTKEFIEGPCRVVNKILEHFDVTTVKDFIGDKDVPLDIYDKENELYISHDFKKPKKLPSIYAGSRIGLSDKYPDFQYKDYRFVPSNYVKNIKKQRKTLKLLS